MRTINAAGLALIKLFEGLRLDAYRDVAGIWTIGYGHIDGVAEGMTFTADQAEAALRADLVIAETAVDRAIAGAPTTDNQFAAMVSLCYNIGSGHFAACSVLRDHRAGLTQAAADAFLRWNKSTVDGVLKEVPGLTVRRKAELRLYLS
jgi:lysozyme